MATAPFAKSQARLHAAERPPLRAIGIGRTGKAGPGPLDPLAASDNAFSIESLCAVSPEANF